jgi:hypothetical protein
MARVAAHHVVRDDKDRVLRKSDGTYTYFVPDIAYHRDKHERGFTRAIDVWGADHHGYVARMRAAMHALGYPDDFFHAEIVQLVRVMRGGEEVRFSKRSGEFITLRDALARLNLCGDCQAGFNRNSQFFLSILDDAPSVLATARPYTQLHDLVRASFDMDARVNDVEARGLKRALEGRAAIGPLGLAGIARLGERGERELGVVWLVFEKQEAQARHR